MRFLILSPPFNRECAGVQVLYYLNDLLHRIGINSDIYGGHPLAADTVVVYPDIIRGNPLGAARIVRYMLYFASAFYGGEKIAAHELPIIYGEFLRADVEAHCEGQRVDTITIPTVDARLWTPAPKTIESMLYFGKGWAGNKPSIPIQIEMPNGTPFEQYRNWVRHTKRFYSLDHHTIACTEALMAGCEVFWVMSPTEFRKFTNPFLDQIRNPHRDIVLARRFVNRVVEFFHL